MEKGEGEPLVFLHGFGLSKEFFQHQTEFFSKKYKVIAIDFPGAGKSAPLKSAYGVKEYAQGIEALLKQMGITKTAILGHSFGGRIAVYLAANTDMVCALILANAAGIKPRFSLRKIIKKCKYMRRKKSMGETERMQSGSPDFRTLSPLGKQSFSKVVGEDLTPMLFKISCPTLIVTGKKDRETPPYTAKVFKKRIKNAKLIVLKKADHFAFFKHHREFNCAVSDFLSSLKRGAK
ncbi:MAG: alpha/beta hydrolase [Clostridiales bacterium]|nr:alpha/beta hydrolase [Clostridiales bacterium]